MHPMLLPSLLMIAGIYVLFRNVRLLGNKDALHDYIMTTSKAKHWLKTYGEEKTVELTRKYLLPLGIVSALVMISIGVWSLWELAPEYLH